MVKFENESKDKRIENLMAQLKQANHDLLELTKKNQALVQSDVESEVDMSM